MFLLFDLKYSRRQKILRNYCTTDAIKKSIEVSLLVEISFISYY